MKKLKETNGTLLSFDHGWLKSLTLIILVEGQAKLK